MSTDLQISEEADVEAVVRALGERRKIDPDVAKRVRARSLRIMEQLRKEHGRMSIAVSSIRGLRDA
jgi:hypothetical protein